MPIRIVEGTFNLFLNGLEHENDLFNIILKLYTSSIFYSIYLVYNRLSSGVTRGARRDIFTPAQNFGGDKLRSECYVLITKYQMSADANNYHLQMSKVITNSHHDHQGTRSEQL